MKLQILTTDGGHLTIHKFDQDTVMNLLESYEHGENKLLTLEMDDGLSYIPKHNVARIDVIYDET